MTEDVKVGVADGICELRFDRPARKNAITAAMYATLADALESAAADDGVRVVVIQGNETVFSAGNDIADFIAMGSAKDDPFDMSVFRFLKALADMDKPMVAAVRGRAVGIGLTLLLHCDMVVAAEDARFGVNGVNIGLFCSTPMVALTRKIPPAVAFEMLTTGEFLTAPRAREVGLVNRLAPPEALEETSLALAQTVAAKLGSAVKIGKAGFYDQLGLPLAQAYAQTGAAMVENMLWRDTQEGIAAFLEKRKPDWG